MVWKIKSIGYSKSVSLCWSPQNPEGKCLADLVHEDVELLQAKMTDKFSEPFTNVSTVFLYFCWRVSHVKS